MRGKAPQQVNRKILDELQNKKENKKTNVARSSGNKHWIIKFLKDFAYISFFPLLWLKDLYKWAKKNAISKKTDQKVNIIKSNTLSPTTTDDTTKNNGNGEITLKEVDEASTEEIIKFKEIPQSYSSDLANNANRCEHECPSPTKSSKTKSNGIT